MALTESTMELALGAEAPDFALPDVVSGKTVRRDGLRGQKALLVMFICTHCPYVKHVEKGLASLGNDYAAKSVSMVAIGSNDAGNYPDDSPAGLKRQAQTLGFPFSYLYDESQAVARAYHAACTPDFFLFDGSLRLVYCGQFDSSRPRQRQAGHRRGSARRHRRRARRQAGISRSAPLDRLQYQVEVAAGSEAKPL